jgi:hypothetical protein
MRPCFLIVLAAFCGMLLACEKVSPDAVDLAVDFSWEGLKPCGWGNPEIHIDGIPRHTRFLKVSMFDHAYSYNHGEVSIPYSGSQIIAKDSLQELRGPCPSYTPGRYEITIKAMDQNNVVIGVGSKERQFPEKE